MSLAARAFLGALIGALAVLLAHPSSRPYLLRGFAGFQPSVYLGQTRSLPENVKGLPVPASLDEAAFWLQVGAEIDRAQGGVSTDDALSLAEIAQIGAGEEPDNAFWHQMEAVWVDEGLQGQPGGSEAVERAWSRGALAVSWNDRQGERLAKVVEGLAQEAGAPFAWHRALAYSRKTTYAAERVSQQAVKLMTSSPADPIRARYEALRNGVLLRDGGRSAGNSSEGIDMIEAAAIGRVRPGGEGNNLRAGALARGRFIEQVRATVGNDAALAASRAFVTNDAWLALVPLATAADQARRTGLASIVSAGLPAALLLVGAAGGLLWAMALGLERAPFLLRHLQSPAAPLLGIGLAAAAFVWAHLQTPAVFLAVVLALLRVRDSWVKEGPLPPLPKAHVVAVWAMVLLAAAGATLFLLASSTASFALGPWVAPLVPIQPGNTLGLQVALVAFLVAACVAWHFAYFNRYPAEKVLAPAIRVFGAGLGIVGLVGAVVATPVSVAVDRNLGDHLTRLVRNEGNTYLLR